MLSDRRCALFAERRLRRRTRRSAAVIRRCAQLLVAGCFLEARGRALLRCALTQVADSVKEAAVCRHDYFARRDSSLASFSQRLRGARNVFTHSLRRATSGVVDNCFARGATLAASPASSAQPPLLRKPLSVSGAAPATFAVVFSFWRRRSAISPLSAGSASAVSSDRASYHHPLGK
ncbi:hypothetical protein HPB51_009792 [Rhipicephalus microplus]|uniref:Uncharacterized protein n=1 Tax=Rhipicephalus microplus TaxID=6941 RepID=A0A9J6F1A7_RHIMP|nr:hypothetical protein HPB51_009792 [Rhipicephalus microplus]